MKPYIPSSLPPAGLKLEPMVRLIADANAELARYDGILQGIINPRVLLSPLTTQEAVLSSRIEGTQATLGEVLGYEASPRQAEDSEKVLDILEIRNYRLALISAERDLKKLPLTMRLLCDAHRQLLVGARGQDKSPGEIRRVQNHIGRPLAPIERATFVPPPPGLLHEHLGGWEKYLHQDDQEPLTQLALIHAQFELIHPFMDGNGRLGRMVIPMFLYYKSRLSSPMFYMSAYLEAHRAEYYDRLLAISQHGDWNGWVRFFLTGVRDQAKENSRKARAILDLYQRMKIVIEEKTRSQFVIKTIDTLFTRPIFNSSDFIDKSKIPKPSAARILAVLHKAKILRLLRSGGGRRPAYHEFSELIRLVEK